MTAAGPTAAANAPKATHDTTGSATKRRIAPAAKHLAIAAISRIARPLPSAWKSRLKLWAGWGPPQPIPRHKRRLPTISAEGMNIVGFLRGDFGVGQSARLCTAAAEAVGLGRSLVDISYLAPRSSSDTSLSASAGASNPYLVNLFHANADYMAITWSCLGPQFFRDRYNIGFWHWEMGELPERCRAGFDYVDEVWVPSQFVAGVVAEKTSVPVVRMPHPIGFQVSRGVSRRDFGLPDDRFLFLMMYDMHSVQERKNPQAAVQAFHRAFPRPDGVGLVVKTQHSAEHPDDIARLRELLQDVPGTILIDHTLSRQQVYDLESVCDALVSLHRGEGFGLGPAECMYLGKPVVATNWSGNTDFMTEANSCPVKYVLVANPRQEGPYDAGLPWAEPDVEHAAWHMRRLVSEPGLVKELGKAARALIRQDYSYQSIGQRYVRRLEFLAGRAKEGGHARAA